MYNISTALIDTSHEFFTINEQIFHLSDGVVQKIDLLPNWMINHISAELESDNSAKRGLDKMKIFNETERIFKFWLCNYSVFDSQPDVTTDGKLGNREFINCSSREKCLGEGKVCRFPFSLTSRQAQVAKRIGRGLMDAEICYDLKISQNTLRVHKNQIEKKIKCTGKVSIGVLCANAGLI